MFYTRVETFNIEEKKSEGGYICATQLLMALKLGISPDCDEYKWKEMIDNSDDPSVKELFTIIFSLSAIPHPEVYIQDKENNVCLYQIEEFEESYDELMYISMNFHEVTKGRYCLIYKSFDIKADEILYEDPYQIVISKETYNKYNNNAKYEIMYDPDFSYDEDAYSTES